MKQYVNLKITRNCGHTESVSFDLMDEFDITYHKQLDMPCVKCMNITEQEQPIVINTNPILEAEIKTLQQNSTIDDPLHMVDDKEENIIVVNSIKCDKSLFIPWEDYKMMSKQKRYEHMCELLKHYGSAKLVARVFDIHLQTVLIECKNLELPSLATGEGRKQLGMVLPGQFATSRTGLTVDLNDLKHIDLTNSPDIVSDESLIPDTIEEIKRLSKKIRRDVLFTLYVKYGSIPTLVEKLNTTQYIISHLMSSNDVYFGYVRQYWTQTYDPEKLPTNKLEYYKIPNEHKRSVLVKLLIKYKSVKNIVSNLNINYDIIMRQLRLYDVTKKNIHDYKN